MRSQTRLRKHLEPGWTLEIPSEGYIEDPLTGNRRPSQPETQKVLVAVQQRSVSGMTETGLRSVIDERVAIILPENDQDPPPEVPPDSALYSPSGERWNAAGKGITRRTARRHPVYTSVAVRRAKEGDT